MGKRVWTFANRQPITYRRHVTRDYKLNPELASSLVVEIRR